MRESKRLSETKTKNKPRRRRRRREAQSEDRKEDKGTEKKGSKLTGFMETKQTHSITHGNTCLFSDVLTKQRISTLDCFRFKKNKSTV